MKWKTANRILWPINAILLFAVIVALASSDPAIKDALANVFGLLIVGLLWLPIIALAIALLDSYMED